MYIQIGQMPFVDLLLLKNPILRFLDKHGIMSFTFPVVLFAKARMNERLAEMAAAKFIGQDPNDSTLVRRGDLLSMFSKQKLIVLTSSMMDAF